MLEHQSLRSYLNFWHAVPVMADCLAHSDEVCLLEYTASATIGSHDATFYSLLLHRRKRPRFRILLLTPLAVDEMIRRGEVTGHPPQQYVDRIIGTLQNLHHLRCKGLIDVEVRLYRHDPEWYFWIIGRNVFVDSHALGIGRRSPRFQFSTPGETGPSPIFVELFENAWAHPGNQEVDFDRFDEQVGSFRKTAEGLLKGHAGSGQPPDPVPSYKAPSVWNIRCETYASPTYVLSQLRQELETSARFDYFGATGESRFGRRSADFAAGLIAGEDGTSCIRISLISPQSIKALQDKLRVSLSGRTGEETREAVGKTLQVLDDLKEEYKLDLEVRLREDLGAIRLYLFENTVCLSSFEPVKNAPSPCILFREEGQSFVVGHWHRAFLESWERGEPESVLVSACPRDGEPEDPLPASPSTIVFDAEKLRLTIDGEPQRLSRAVLLFLVATAYERGRCLPLDEDIDGRPARKRRTELGMRLGRSLAKHVLETVPGLGYRFQPGVRVLGVGQVRGSVSGSLKDYPDPDPL